MYIYIYIYIYLYIYCINWYTQYILYPVRHDIGTLKRADIVAMASWRCASAGIVFRRPWRGRGSQAFAPAADMRFIATNVMKVMNGMNVMNE